MEPKTEYDSLLTDWALGTPLTQEDLTSHPKTKPCCPGSPLSKNNPKPKSKCKRCCCSKAFLLIGFFTSLTLCLLVQFTPYVENTFNVIVIRQLPLSEGSERAKLWATGVPPLQYRMYVFNLTNPGQFKAGARPIVEEVGPFTYEVTETRENLVYNGSVLFFQAKPVFKFQPDLSVPGGQDLAIYTLNIPLVNAGDMAKTKAKSAVFRLFRDAFSFESVRKLTAGELLWGHPSRILNVARKFTDVPYPYEQFALIAGRNATLQPLTSMNIGLEDVYSMNQVLSYDGPGPKTGCNAVFGTDGSAFGPGVNESSVLFVYNGQFCRSLPLVYDGAYESGGLRALRFVLPRDVFSYADTPIGVRNSFGNSRYRKFRRPPACKNGSQANGSGRNGNGDGEQGRNDGSKSTGHKQRYNRPRGDLKNRTKTPQDPSGTWKSYYGGSNRCFCVKGQCPPDGVLDMGPCLMGAPVGFSFPHFLYGAPHLRHLVRGLRPDPALHSTEFDIFPDLGVPLRVKLRMQMNVILDKNQALNRARHFDIIYPIFWFEAGIDSLPVPLVEKLQMAQDLPPLMKRVFVVICGGLSVVFFILLMAQTFVGWCRGGSGSRGSSNETISSGIPEPQNRDSLNTDVQFPDSGEYKSFTSPNLLPGDRPSILIDTHTLLPPYKQAKPGDIAPIPPNKRKLVGTNSDSGVESKVYEPKESKNEYPPEYDSVASTDPPSNRSSCPSLGPAEIEVHRPDSDADTRAHPPAEDGVTLLSDIGATDTFRTRVLSLKPLPAVPRIAEDSLKKSVAPRASPEPDVDDLYSTPVIPDQIFSEPLATSSPMATLGHGGSSHDDPRPLGSPSSAVGAEATPQSDPASTSLSRLSSGSAPENYYLAPPLESDL